MRARGAAPAARRGCARRAARVLGWGLALAALLVVVVRLFVADVYPVASASMRPTIYAGAAAPGEPVETAWVLVRYDRSPPRRGELVVVAAEAGGEPLVKRVVGLPGESIRLARGDVFVDGRPLGDDASWRRPVPLWDSAVQPVLDWLTVPLAPAGPWRTAGAGFELGAGAEGALRHELWLHPPARDGYLAPDGTRVAGTLEANDLVLELTVVLASPAPAGEDAALVLALGEEGDALAAVLRPEGAGGATATLWRAPLDTPLAALASDPPPAGAERLAGGELALTTGAPVVLALANVDDRLSLRVDGVPVLAAPTPPNRPHERPGAGSVHVAPRARMAADLPLELERVRVLRDQLWAPAGAFAVERELLLGPDEVFLLGDNTRASTDSRSFGPVPLARLRGRAAAVVWPPDRARWL